MDKKKKILTIITIILFIIVLFLAYLLFNRYVLKNNFENQILPIAKKNENVIFKINKIVLFSNCDAKNKNSSASNFTLENLYQYTDMAIFISNDVEEKSLENTFKKVTINNIKFNLLPSDGEPKLYFKGLNQDFNITSEDEANFDTPTLYNNLANPITLSYVNKNIKSDYTITDTSSPITYDGSLLKRCNVNLESLSCNLSFDIYITNNKDEEFKCTVFIDIPLFDGDKTIYDGNITLNKDTNFVFYRYK